MFNGKPVAELNQQELTEMVNEMLKMQQVNERETRRIEEEKAKLEAARQLAGMSAGTASQRRNTSNTVVSGAMGKIGEFALDDDWSSWLERFELYCETNEVHQEKYVSLFLTLMGKEAYALLKDLCSPRVVKSLTFEELASLMKDHLQPAPNVIMERYKFKKCRQQHGEDIKKYVVNLKKRAAYCDFGNSLENCLRDQFVWGLSDEAVKKKLLGERGLSFHRAVELAFSLEAASRDAAEMHVTSSATAASGINVLRDKREKASVKVRNCFCCGRPNHMKANCLYKNFKCRQCGKVGHLQAVCVVKSEANSANSKETKRESQSRTQERQHFLEERDLVSESIDSIFTLRGSVLSDAPIKVEIAIENEKFLFELDTGSPITAISEKMYRNSKALSRRDLERTGRTFKFFSGDNCILPLGVARVNVKFLDRCKVLDLFVLPGSSETPIIGRTWLRELSILDLKDSKCSLTINTLQQKMSLADEVGRKFPNVFSKVLGRYKGKTFTLNLKRDAEPIFIRARPVPLALRKKMDCEFDRLESNEIIEKVNSSPWATPVVPVLKSNGDIRVCGDFKITLNPLLEVDKYPIPRVNDLLADLEIGESYSEIDLSHAYEQFELDEESQLLTTISTHKGLYKYKRLPYGVASAPAIFQREMEEVLRDIPGLAVYFDNIFVSGKTTEEHNKSLYEVLERLDSKGLTVEFKKCKFGQKQITFLGFRLDKEGLHVAEEKVKPIRDMAAPRNVKELQSFLGAINFYAKFIRNLAEIISPLCELLRKDVAWVWSNEREKAFQKAKDSLMSSEVLSHYDVDLPLVISCDASPKGIGAVLSHVFPQGESKPIAFASKVLSRSEQNYSQLDREALALVFGVKSFNQYVYGRKFVLETDHKPLIYIFGKKRGIPQMAASRVQRWAVFLAGYDFDIKHIRGKDNGPADALSRVLSKFRAVQNSAEAEEYSNLNYVCEETEMISCDTVSTETEKDPMLQKVRNLLYRGWPSRVDPELQVFKNKQYELTVERGIIMWGHRVVLPAKLIPKFLRELHSAHGGIVKLKALARSLVWWPGIDKDIENLVKSCEFCQQISSFPPRSALQPWPLPEGPNERIHLDFCGPIEGHSYLVLIDAYSKWVDIRDMCDITASSTIRVLKEYFSVWGLPKLIVSDNGPAFIADDFKLFLIRNDIKQLFSPPYHPASNGIAENAVKSFKAHFKKLVKTMPKHDALFKYLLFCRSTPHCTTGVSPAELQIGRKLRTRLCITDSTIRAKVTLNQEKQKRYFKGNRQAFFNVGDIVLSKDYSANKWIKTQISDILGPVSYNVRTKENKVWKRHVDQLRTCEENKYSATEVNMPVSPQEHPQSELTPSVQCENVAKTSNSQTTYPVVAPSENNIVTTVSNDSCTSAAKSPPANSRMSIVPELRRSTRVCKPVQRLNL